MHVRAGASMHMHRHSALWYDGKGSGNVDFSASHECRFRATGSDIW